MNDRLNILIRYKYGGYFTEDDENIPQDEIINKFWNLTDKKIEKHAICILKDYVNDDFLFKEILEKYKPSITFFKEDIDSKACSNCQLNCFENLSTNFVSITSFFIIQIHNRRDYLSKEDIKRITSLFFQEFYLINGVWENNFEEVFSLLTDYDLDYLSESLSKNSYSNNLEELYKAKISLDDLHIRIKNMNKSSTSEDLEELQLLLNFIDNKIRYNESMYNFEKDLQKSETDKPRDEDEKIKPLKDIWLADAKISVKDFLIVGIENKLWDKEYNLITQKGKLYGTGKKLLGSLSIALRRYSISENTNYKVVGNAFCEVFNIEINKNTKQPFKDFSSGNQKYIDQFKRVYKIPRL